MASATCLTASKISLLVGLGLRRSFFNLTFAFSSALLCSGSSPSLSCIDRRQSMQYCRFLSCFMGPPSPARDCRCRRAAPEKEWTEPKNSPNVCRTTNNQHTPTNRLTDSEGFSAYPADLQACSVGLMGLNYSHRHGPSEAPTALRPSPDDEGLGTRSDSKPEDLSKNLPNRQ